MSWCYNKVVNRVTSVNKWCLHTMVLKLVSGTTGECMPLNGDGPVPYWLSWSFSPLSPLDSVSHGSWPWTVWQRNSAQQFLMKNKKTKNLHLTPCGVAWYQSVPASLGVLFIFMISCSTTPIAITSSNFNFFWKLIRNKCRQVKTLLKSFYF